MMNDSNQITQILTISLMFLMIILLVLIVILIVVQVKKKMAKDRAEKQDTVPQSELKPKSNILEAKLYSKQSILNFMEFDKIQDNMIIQKNGLKYLMVLQCQGINYDLMSVEEKNGVEQGFQQFLNTLRHPVQLYIQTRTVNLQSSLENYNIRLKEIEDKLVKLQNEYDRMRDSGEFSDEELMSFFREVTKQRNMYEYGKDIIANTEKMSMNKNVLNKQYYVIIPYYVDDFSSNNMDKEEMKNTSFSELYSRAQSIMRTLSICGINSKILNSTELIELLYVAYNRDESEVFGIDKMIRARYDELYSTAEDVLTKKMRAIDKKIENEAIELANSKILEVKQEREEERILKEKQERYEELVREMAELLIDENKAYIGEETAKRASSKIKNEINKKGESNNAKRQKKTKRTRV